MISCSGTDKFLDTNVWTLFRVNLKQSDTKSSFLLRINSTILESRALGGPRCTVRIWCVLVTFHLHKQVSYQFWWRHRWTVFFVSSLLFLRTIRRLWHVNPLSILSLRRVLDSTQNCILFCCFLERWRIWIAWEFLMDHIGSINDLLGLDPSCIFTFIVFFFSLLDIESG